MSMTVGGSIRHNKISWIALSVLLLCVPAQAEDWTPSKAEGYTEFVVKVPNGLIEDGLKWQHFYANRKGSNLREEGTAQERAQFFLDKCVFDPSTKWVLDSVLFVKTWGRVKSLAESGITVEVKK